MNINVNIEWDDEEEADTIKVAEKILDRFDNDSEILMAIGSTLLHAAEDHDGLGAGALFGAMKVAMTVGKLQGQREAGLTKEVATGLGDLEAFLSKVTPPEDEVEVEEDPDDWRHLPPATES
jgi:hypothetical protein